MHRAEVGEHVWAGALIAAMLAFPTLSAAAAEGAKPTAGEAQLFAALEEDIPQLIRLTGVPGLNLAVARRGQVIWEAGFGYADLERRIPMTASTVTHSGSMGKTYTATAVMQLVERGVLSLDAPVNRYLPGWKIVNPLGGREVTVRDLLTHRSGLAGNGAWSTLSTPQSLAEHVPAAYARERNDFYGGAASPTWTAKAGEVYQYSNLGMATLGYLVQVTNPEKSSFSDYVERHIIDPLGMTSTQYPPVQDQRHIRPEIWQRLSKGYSSFGPLRIPTPAIYFADHPAGTVVTTPADHVRLLLAMQHGGRYNGYQLLKQETVNLMLSPQAATGPDKDLQAASVGLVWNLRNWNKPERSFDHSGAHMWGWTNRFIDYPDLDLAMAVFMNHWSLPNDARGARYREATYLIDFVRSWIQRERAGRLRPVSRHSWAWKVSYVAGLMTVHSVNGTLGIKERLSPEMLGEMVRGEVSRPEAVRDANVWDAAGYHAGIKDMGAAEQTPAGIAAFMKSDRLQVLPEELPLLYLELGGNGSLPAAN